MLRTARFRIRANNKEKYHRLEKTAGVCRFAWNYFNGELRDDYRKDGYQNCSHAELGNRVTGWGDCRRSKICSGNHQKELSVTS